MRAFCRVLSSELVERKQKNTNSNQQKTRLDRGEQTSFLQDYSLNFMLPVSIISVLILIMGLFDFVLIFICSV